MIIVTGATGQLGSQIVDRLLTRVPVDQLGVSVRDPDRAAELATRGVSVRRGDNTDPDSLTEAFEGATQVLLVSAGATGSAAVAQHIAAIDAAVEIGARVVYTSHQAAGADSRFAPMRDHAATEAYLTGLSTPVTILRNGFYASTVPRLLGRALDTGELAAPADGPVSWTAHADLATAAAVVLTHGQAGQKGYDGVTPALTAPDATDLDGVAAMLSASTGQTIRRVVVDDDAWVTGLIGHGVPADQARLLLGLFEASRRGEFATTGPALGELIGGTPRPLRTLLDELVAVGDRAGQR